jgi:hypothetical protein
VIMTGAARGEQLCWSEPWMRFSARTAARATDRGHLFWCAMLIGPELKPVIEICRSGKWRIKGLSAAVMQRRCRLSSTKSATKAWPELTRPFLRLGSLLGSAAGAPTRLICAPSAAGQPDCRKSLVRAERRPDRTACSGPVACALGTLVRDLYGTVLSLGSVPPIASEGARFRWERSA